MRILPTLGGVLLAGVLVGCGGDSNPTSTGKVNVSLVDGPISGYKAITVNIIRVEISQDGSGWTTLATPSAGPVNLLSLTGGQAQTLANGATLAPGTYGQMRLILGASGNTVTLADDSVHDLTIPSGVQTGIKLVGPFVVQAGTTADIWIDFDAAHSIQVVGAGNSGKYMLRPTVWAYDKAVTGSISGTLTDANGGAPLPGVRVTAQTLDNGGNPTVQRATITDANGHYTLDLLPVGGSYYVVSLPATATTVYDPKASAAFALSSATPVFTYNESYTADANLGGIDGTVTPMAGTDQTDVVNLLGTLGSQTFVLGTTVAAVGTSSETFSFTGLPAAAYSLVGVRTTAGTTPVVTPAAAVPVTVTAGGTASATVAF